MKRMGVGAATALALDGAAAEAVTGAGVAPVFMASLAAAFFALASAFLAAFFAAGESQMVYNMRSSCSSAYQQNLIMFSTSHNTKQSSRTLTIRLIHNIPTPLIHLGSLLRLLLIPLTHGFLPLLTIHTDATIMGGKGTFGFE